MECAILGIVMSVSSYKSKQTGGVVGQLHVASGEQMLIVKTDNYEDFSKMQLVVVTGEATPREREIWLKEATVRAATDSDREFFKGVGFPRNSHAYEVGVAA